MQSGLHRRDADDERAGRQRVVIGRPVRNQHVPSKQKARETGGEACHQEQTADQHDDSSTASASSGGVLVLAHNQATNTTEQGQTKRILIKKDGLRCLSW
jgi:hypothetical protein